MKNLFYLMLILVTCRACSSGAETEKFQNDRNNVVNVREKVKEIKIEDVFIGSIAGLFLIGDYLIVVDPRSYDNLIRIFDKNNFKYVTSIANKGKGPGEITNIGHAGIDEARRKFYVNDHGKQCIFGYDLDSVLIDPEYMPSVKMRMDGKLFPSEYEYISDTLCIGRIIKPIGNSDFSDFIGRWSMNTGEITPMKYEHPEIEKSRVNVAASEEYGLYAECYHHHDLMTICSFSGDLKYNIYGKNWDSRKSNRIYHYGDIVFCNDKILVSYSGKDNFSADFQPTKILVFDINGDYFKTLETEYSINDICYDKRNNRLIMNLNEEMQFAYLNLDGLIE